MRVVTVVDGDMELGRGPLSRLHAILPELTDRCEIHLALLSPPGPELLGPLSRLGLTYREFPVNMEGWRMLNAENRAEEISSWALDLRADLVVLQWELWDLMDTLGCSLEREGVAFATVLHAVPFLNAPLSPSGVFLEDVSARIRTEPDPRIRAFLRERQSSMKAVLGRTNALVPNRTTANYLTRYFPWLQVFEISPGYALDLDAVNGISRAPDIEFVFMSKLVAEKGIYELLEIFEKARRLRPAARLLLIGSFEEEDERQRFWKDAIARGLDSAIEVTGWLSGPAKYAALCRGKVFLYPASGSDTFCIGLLEALAVGLPAIALDVAFVRDNYPEDVVRRVPLGNPEVFAREAVALLEDKDRVSLRARARAFAAGFGSSSSVAQAETDAYQKIINSHRESRRLGSTPVRSWLLQSGIQVAGSSHQGAVKGWLTGKEEEEFLYPEAAGYYLTWLRDLADAEPTFAAEASRAGARTVTWLQELIGRDPAVPTRIYPDSTRSNWRTEACFSFDWAVIVRGLVAAGELLPQPDLRSSVGRVLAAGTRFLAEPIVASHHHHGDSKDALPVKWSTMPWLHHLKTCALLEICSQSWCSALVPKQAMSTIRATLDHWTAELRKPHFTVGQLHPWLYGLEGLFLLGELYNSPALTDQVVDEIHRLLPWQGDDGGLPDTDRGGCERRADVQAQALRLGVALLHFGHLRPSWHGRLERLRSALLRHIGSDGAVTFRPPTAAGPAHENCCCALFTWQALSWWDLAEQGKPFPRSRLLRLI